jgi:hypothetical protein
VAAGRNEELFVQFVRGVERVHCRHRGAGSGRAVEHCRIEDRVRTVQRDHVAVLDPEFGEAGRQPPGHLVELGVTDLLAGDAVDQGRPVAVFLGATENGFVQRLAEHLDRCELAEDDHGGGPFR